MEINGKEVEVNRKDAVVRDFDKQYCELLKKILEEGELFENRTGVDTLSIPGGGYVFDVGNEFPILESKKIMLKNALSELLWIYQAQTNVVSWLRERGNNIWNEWEVDSDGIYRIYESTTEEYDEDKEVNVYDLDGNIIIGMKATIKDRYFNSACATPASVFPILFKLENSHIKKLEREKGSGSKIFYEKIIGNLMEKLVLFPRSLSLEEQGKFMLGYYHQTQKKYEKKENK